MNPNPCYCGQSKPYSECCGVYHSGKTWPTSPELLMRARYAAYAAHQVDFIEKTNDPTSKDQFDKAAAEAWSKKSLWKGLEIVAAQGDQVEFKAHFEVEGKAHTHHEVSRFSQIQGRWYYSEGREILEPIRRAEPKLGRNDPY